MKIKRNIFLLIASSFFLLLTSCGNNQTPSKETSSTLSSSESSETSKSESSKESESSSKESSSASESSSSSSSSEHVHTFSDTLTFDEHTHWYPSTCGHDVKKDEAPHSFVVSDRKEPTYEEAGYIQYTCNVCSYSYKDDIDPLEHHYSDTYQYDSYQHWRPCIDEGYEHLRIDVEDHNLTIIGELDPTYEDDGYISYGCNCGYSYIETIDKLEHQFDGYGHDENNHWHKCIDEGYEDEHFDEEPHDFGDWVVTKEPTQTESGSKQKTCSVCKYVEEEIIPSYEEQTIQDLEFELSNDETYYLVKKANASIASAYIPSTYKGLPVKEIKEDAFKDCSLLTTVVLPTSVIRIGSRAFYNCVKLNSINLHDEIVEIGQRAFYSCALEEVHIPSPLTTINSGLFALNTKLESISIPEGITSLGSFVFSGCSGLKTVNLPLSLTSIGDGAFGGCTKLESIIIPKNVETIGQEVFSSDTSLKSVTFNTDKITRFEQRLFVGSGIESIVIPDSVTYIGNSCFNSCLSLKTVTVGKNVTTIEQSAFAMSFNIETFTYNAIECRNIKEHIFGLDWAYFDEKGAVNVVIGDGVKYVPSIFTQCLKTKSITISGTVEEIEVSAFSGCTGVTTFAFDTTNVKTIGNDAFSRVITSGSYDFNFPNIEFISGFSYCTGIRSVTFGNKLEEIDSDAFRGCTQLSHVDLGNSVERIGESAFSGCTNLGSFIIPNSVSEVGNEAFTNVKGIVYVEGNNYTSWPENWLYNSRTRYYVDENYEILKDENFEYVILDSNSVKIVNCLSNEDELTIPNTVTLNEHVYNITEIGNRAFEVDCPNKLIFGENITRVCEYAFYGSNTPKEIVVNQGLTTIERYAFYEADIERVYLHNTDDNLEFDTEAFCNCYKTIVYQEGHVGFENVKNITMVPSNYEALIIGGYECQYNQNSHSLTLLKYRSNDTVVNIPTSLNYLEEERNTGLSQEAFQGLEHIKEVNIPSGFTMITYKCFYNCTGLETVNFNEGLQGIENYAFMNCSSLKEINLPNSLEYLQGDPFGGECGLEEIYIGENVSQIISPSNVPLFSGVNLKRIIVSENNTNYKSIDGILYSKNETEYFSLLACPRDIELTSLRVENSNISIGEYSFYKTNNLVSLYLDVRYIYSNSIYGLESLKTLFIKCINMSNTVGYAPYLEKIYILSSKDEWDALGFNVSILNNNANIYYYNNDPNTAVEGQDWHYDQSGNPLIW